METNSFGHYVVFDGSERELNKVLGGLEEVGLSIIRSGASTREADNGQFYDWFIRLDFNGTREEALSLAEKGIAHAVMPLSSDTAEDPDQSLVLKNLVSDPVASQIEDAGLDKSDPSAIIKWLSQQNDRIAEDAEQRVRSSFRNWPDLA